MDAAFDFQMPLLVVSLAGAAGVIIYLISVFGIREKTFEEAIASQKEISQELLGRKDQQQKKKAVKRKVKAKKEDKPQKEKEPEKEKEKETHPHPHVEICPQPIILDENHSVRRPSLATVGGRRESIKSILVNKSEVSPIGDGDSVIEANHFENRHPKDDFELKKQVSTEDELPMGNGVVDDIENEIEEEIIEAAEAVQVGSEVPAPTSTVSTDNGAANNNSRKQSKKSKKAGQVPPTSDLNPLKLVSIIEKTTMSKDEIQNLIEYLLNRQVDADVSTDWVNKSKNDTTATLKKALAEKEAQLAEEKAMVETLQQKLKDLRQEFNAEKNRLTGLKKALEDRNTALQQESQQFQIRVQQLNSMLSDKATVERQIQEVQRRNQVLQDENLNIKKVLSTDQSFRMKAEGLEREVEALRAQCAHLESQIQSSFQSNSDFATQVHGLQDHIRNLEIKVGDYEHLQGFSAQLQERETHLLNELKHTEAKVTEAEAEKNVLKEKLKEVEEEIRGSKEEADRKVEESNQNEKNTKNLLQETQSNLTHLENQLKAKELELQNLQVEKDSATEDLRLRNQKLEEDAIALEQRLGTSDGSVAALNAAKEELNAQISKSETEIHKLNQKNSELEAENSKLSDSLRLSENTLEAQSKAAESHAIEVETKSKEVQLRSIQEQLESLSGITVQKNSEGWITDFFKELASRLTPPKEDNSAHVEEIEKLQGEVEHYQRTLQNTETILTRLEQSIADSEKTWEEKLQAKNKALEEALKATEFQANLAHLEVELNLQRESNAKLIQLNRDLEEKLSNSNSHSQKEDTVSIASLEELKSENEELRAEVQRLSTAPHTEVANGNATNGTTPKLNSSPSSVSIESKGSETKGNEGDPLSPTGETKKKKKTSSNLRLSKLIYFELG